MSGGLLLICPGSADYVSFKAFNFVCCLFVGQAVIKKGGVFM